MHLFFYPKPAPVDLIGSNLKFWFLEELEAVWRNVGALIMNDPVSFLSCVTRVPLSVFPLVTGHRVCRRTGRGRDPVHTIAAGVCKLKEWCNPGPFVSFCEGNVIIITNVQQEEQICHEQREDMWLTGLHLKTVKPWRLKEVKIKKSWFLPSTFYLILVFNIFGRFCCWWTCIYSISQYVLRLYGGIRIFTVSFYCCWHDLVQRVLLLQINIVY